MNSNKFGKHLNKLISSSEVSDRFSDKNLVFEKAINNIDFLSKHLGDLLNTKLKSSNLDNEKLNKSIEDILARINDIKTNENSKHKQVIEDFGNIFQYISFRYIKRESRLKEQSLSLVNTINLLVNIIDEIKDSVIVVDKSNNDILYVNESGRSLFYNPNTSTFICGKETCPLMNKLLLDEISTQAETYEYYCSVSKNTTKVRTVEVNWGDKKAYAHYLTDITMEKMDRNEIERLAYYDELTKCFNRRYFFNAIDSMFLRDNGFVLCIIDMNELKRANDNFGHHEGDIYIKSVVNELLKEFQAPNIVARIGGDEFAIISEILSEKELIEGLEKVNHRLQILAKETSLYNMGVSYGAVYVKSGSNMDYASALELADRKMYAYKKNSKVKINNINGYL